MSVKKYTESGSQSEIKSGGRGIVSPGLIASLGSNGSNGSCLHEAQKIKIKSENMKKTICFMTI